MPLKHLVVFTAAALAPASGLVAHAPLLRTVAPVASARVAAPPQMILGGAGRSFGRAIRRVSPARLPGFPKGGFGRGGSIRGCDGGGGGATAGGETAASDDDESPNALVQAWKTYESLLDEKPLLMKALTSFVGFALGDILAQKFITKGEFDWFRLARLASFGFLVHGTSSHWFYGWLDAKIPGTTARVVFTKVFIDQVLWNPCFGVMFFSYVALLEAKGIQYVIDKTRNELFTQVTGSWKVWPLAHTINFRYIPSSQRVLYINTIQIGYNCFLSMISNR